MINPELTESQGGNDCAVVNSPAYNGRGRIPRVDDDDVSMIYSSRSIRGYLVETVTEWLVKRLVIRVNG